MYYGMTSLDAEPETAIGLQPREMERWPSQEVEDLRRPFLCEVRPPC